ncbi:MAG: metal ABC transporter permease, partial [Clostridia bacterium]|nr:metal ABC transporter permease [Clostridia bacterium]
MSFINAITEIFSYPFLTVPLVVGVLVSLCAALLGSVLVLKRFSMIGDGLSHVGYGALCVSAAAGVAPLKIAIPVVIVAAFFLLRISRNSRINGDSA